MINHGADEIGRDIVKYQRSARFADTSIEEWTDRLRNLVAVRTGCRDARIADVHEVGTAAGGSNGTLLFNAVWHDDAGEHDEDLVLRFLPTHGLFHQYDVEAQFNLQRALEATAVPVPSQLWLDAQGAELGRAGYVMKRVAGASTPMTWMTSGIIAEAAPGERTAMQLSYLGALAKIHAVDWREAGLEWMEQRAEGRRPIEREVNWYWDALVQKGVPAYVSALRPIRDWLIANEPDGLAPVLCHGDANFGNYLYVGTDVSAVVDWEMSFLGFPECDLTFTHIGDQIIQRDVPPLAGTLDYAERIRAYEELSGLKLSNLPYFELFTAYRLAVINVLTLRHFPPSVIEMMLPVIERGPRIAAELAEAQGVACSLPASGTVS